jgi:hypothetical protein
MNTGGRHGIYRIHGSGGEPDEVQVEDASGNMTIPARDYIDRRYEPPFRDLPWRDEYLVKKAEAEKMAREAAAAAAKDQKPKT